MSLIIVGDVERTLPVAAVASVTSGEHVRFTSEEDLGELTVPVTGNGLSGTALIEAVAPGAPTDADSFVVAAPAMDLAGILTARPQQFAGKPVLLAPGGFAGALLCVERFRQLGVPLPQFSEVPGWMFGGRLADGFVQMFMRKRNLDLAASSDEETAAALAHFGRYFPDLVPSDLVTTSLSNINALIHPPLAILNATRIENREAWHYWDEGFTPAAERLMVAIDRERRRIVEALGGRADTILEMALAAYGDDGMRGDSYFETVKSFDGYRNRLGPTDLASRFLTDDVPFGVAGYEQLAERIGIDHPALTAVRVLSEVILGRELKADDAAVTALVRYGQGRSTVSTGAGSPGRPR
ncbi:NAD/NADP octopine/nopaline dehydrogenase family protein [Georgenia yuyongxinii]|uniref:Opine dehydrogenase domain-containing protein n=1 Tax=Georgenia yuyongxinii TaxID=2589797 RepID=A0A552WSI2_9MICO|nr:NAD/NADP octopine/nopaline dehydrogenase family protein [Georgenia yuyongxinii]TRW45801.1 hypothetical protein FJ693_07875 [Georgenia yuyongxinii]